jgi:hypothetical protein
MGLWSKIGKIALTAAPYIAAPFTGGASLSLAPLANKAVGKWNERDAQKQYEKTGIAPSPNKANQIMGMVGDFASGMSGSGGWGGAGGTLGGKTGSILRDIGSQTGAGGGFGGMVGRAASGGRGGISPTWENTVMNGGWGGGFGGGGGSSPGFGGGSFDWGGGGMNTTQPMGKQGSIGGLLGGAIEAIMNRRGVGGQPQYEAGGTPAGSVSRGQQGGQIYDGPIGRRLGVGNQVDQSMPNLSYALAQGKAEAMRNQRRQPMQMMPMQDWSTPRRRPQYEEEEAYY